MILEVYSRNIFFQSRWVGLIILTLFLTAGCSSQKAGRYEVPYDAEQDAPGFETPYRVANITYYPLTNAAGFGQTGIASWYGPNFNGKLTSNQEVYDMNAMTAAHKTLPFNTRVRVTNLENGKETVVRINDRGPFVNNRIIDLSFKAAKILDIVKRGTAKVRLTALTSGNHGQKESRNENGHKARSFAVQIGSFKELDNAKLLVRKTANSRIKSVIRNGAAYYKVIVGSYATFDKAHLQMENLRRRGYHNAFIISAN